MSKNSFQIGYTIGGGQGEERKVRLAREQKEKKEQRHKIVFVALGAVGVLLLLAVIAKGFSSLQEMVTSKNEKEKIASIAPTVNIINENGQNDEISNRVKTFVARVEEGVSDNDLRVEHAVLPSGRIREVDVFLKGRGERYKMNLDRGVAVQVEDAVRMKKYLDQNNLQAEYVDIRVEGRAFYK